MVTWGSGVSGIGSYCLLGTEFQFGMDENVLEMDSGGVTQQCECT